MADIKVIDQSNCISIVKDIITKYCAVNDLDEHDIPPQIWNDIIDEIYINVFKDNTILLKDIPSPYNQYNQDKVLYIYNYIYKRICNNHCQEVTLKGFIDMTGIDKQTIYNWKSSNTRFDLHEKIMDDNEQSLEAMLHDKRINPMKVLPSLNKKHGWNLPGVSREKASNTAISLSDLPKLGAINGTIGQIQDNNAVLEDKENG